MEYCCPVECEEFSVTPVFSPPPVRVNMCPDIAMCPPCLPEGPSIVYRCEKPPEPRYEEKEYGHRPQHDGEKHRSKHCCDSEAHESKPEKRKIYFCCEMAPPKNCSMPPPTKTKKQEVLFCCEVPAPKMSMKMSMAPECCKPKTNKKEVFFCCEEPPKKSYTPPPKDCCIPTKPIKTKYMIPCYRYEDGRVEQYVPTRMGRLPTSAYRRNGIQDIIYGYRGATRELCAGRVKDDVYCVNTIIQPLRTIYPRITQEVHPIKKKKEKKCF